MTLTRKRTVIERLRITGPREEVFEESGRRISDGWRIARSGPIMRDMRATGRYGITCERLLEDATNGSEPRRSRP